MSVPASSMVGMTTAPAEHDPNLVKVLQDVVAVVHASDGNLLIWHVDVGPDNGLARMAGAWVLATVVLEDAVVPEDAVTLLRGRRVLATAEGRAAVEEFGVPIDGFVDPDATLAGIGEEVAALQEAFETAVAGRKAKLVNPSWPASPAALDVAAGDDAEGVAVVLGIARWLEGLAKTWERVEAQRATRTFLLPDVGKQRRSLPVRF